MAFNMSQYVSLEVLFVCMFVLLDNYILFFVPLMFVYLKHYLSGPPSLPRRSRLGTTLCSFRSGTLRDKRRSAVLMHRYIGIVIMD